MRKIGIEELLTWAFTQELPKFGTSEALGPSFSQAWSMMIEVAALGTMVDRSPNAFGVLPTCLFEGDPHPDAIIVGEAVRALAERSFEIAPDWNPVPEWSDEHGLIREAVTAVVDELVDGRSARTNGRHIVTLVTCSASLKRGPDWKIGAAPSVVVLKRNGKDPAWFIMQKGKDSFGRSVQREVDGFDYKKRRPRRGAYNKHRLDGSVRGAVLSRLDWQIWQSALEDLYSSLYGRLNNHDLLPFTPDRQPWCRSRRDENSQQAFENA